MQRLWSAEELLARWSLMPADMELLAAFTSAGKLGLAAQLAFWRQQGRFPDDEADLAPAVVAHRRVLDGGDARGDRSRRGAPAVVALPLRAWHQRRAEAPCGRPARLHLQGAAAHAPALRRRRRLARRHQARGQRDAGRASSQGLGRGHDRLRVGLQAVRRLRPEPDDRVARPLRRPRRHDLLARRARIGVHPFAAQALLVVRGRRHDRGRAAARHRDGDRAAVRRQPRPERGGVRLLPAARLRSCCRG